ncbi:T9SS type A sorting domain-containing protein [Reichenbachiella ulvae]|uniref:T9SS type A sorting domain-containing protein n=1 Tax=Reichenbachiella ulvae TaxID=2980104 RepID=A0ABT3D0A9_9BACT|nr:T9SS type A sorting domain-containing protein [Reichenbachiella ulvae]MCV9389251.1 T9SS type A sorting domain-containing protein [Reichenbachiella ulvae]
MKKNYLLIALLFTLSFAPIAQDLVDDKENALDYSRKIENRLNYKESISPDKLDYHLEPLENGKFKLIFVNRPSDYVNIKIYDIIGNLVLTEEKKYMLNSEIEYNFNETNSKIYVVKVESGDENLTKKVNF